MVGKCAVEKEKRRKNGIGTRTHTLYILVCENLRIKVGKYLSKTFIKIDEVWSRSKEIVGKAEHRWDEIVLQVHINETHILCNEKRFSWTPNLDKWQSFAENIKGRKQRIIVQYSIYYVYCVVITNSHVICISRFRTAFESKFWAQAIDKLTYSLSSLLSVALFLWCCYCFASININTEQKQLHIAN